MECKHFRVSGRVQGVFYRASTREQAQALGLSGWVRNCDDGSVELVACGEPGQLQKLEDWLWQGPDHARVVAVDSKVAADEDMQRFEVRY